MNDDEEGKAMVEYMALIPPSPYPSMLPLEVAHVHEATKEVMVATVEVELLHRRMGHMGSATMARLGRDDLVRGLKGGVVGRLGVCHGCELGEAIR